MTRPDEIRIGEKGDPIVAEVSPAFGYDGFWSVTLWRRNSNIGVSIQPEIHDRDLAIEVATFLRDKLSPCEVVLEDRQKRRWQEEDERRRAREEQERPAREAAGRQREQDLREAPTVEVAECGTCGHLAEEPEFDEPVYECSGCGSTARGIEEGRRCDSCHRFRAKVASLSCPECEEPQETLTLVEALRLPDGELVPPRPM